MSKFVENKSIDTSISGLYLNSDLADVNFAFKGNGSTVLVPAHKLILASASSVFRTMFFGSLPEKEIVEIVDATADEFEEFLQLFYLRKIKQPMENIAGVTRLADKYGMLDCMNSCKASVEAEIIDKKTLWAYQAALCSNNRTLEEFCENKIGGFSADWLRSKTFLNCDKITLKNILLMHELGCDEIVLFEACIEWAKAACRKKQLNEHDSENLKEQVGDCMHLIKFSQMTKDDLGKIMNNKLYADIIGEDVLLDITQAILVVNVPPQNQRKKTLKTPKPRMLEKSMEDLSFSKTKSPELIVSRNADGYHKYNLDSKEMTRFVSNSRLLLGNISFYFDSKLNFDFDFEVINCFSNKTLHIGKMNSSNLQAALGKGILIEPQELYMVRVNIPLKMVGCPVDIASSRQQQDFNIGPGIIIKFPNYKDVIVSSMSFKQI